MKIGPYFSASKFITSPVCSFITCSRNRTAIFPTSASVPDSNAWSARSMQVSHSVIGTTRPTAAFPFDMLSLFLPTSIARIFIHGGVKAREKEVLAEEQMLAQLH